MVSPVVIGSAVGAALGAVLIAVFVTCIIYINKKLKKRTNARSQLITSTGEVYKEKWAEDESRAKQEGDNKKKTYFGNIDKTEHVEVKEKRRREEIILPPAEIKYPPRPRPQPLPRSRTPPPRPRNERLSPPIRRRASIGHAEGAKYFIYGMPYPVPRAMTGPWFPAPNLPPAITYPVVAPAAPQPTPQPAPQPLPQPKNNVRLIQREVEHNDIEEQERVMVIDDWMTEKTFNPRWTGGASAIIYSEYGVASGSGMTDYSHSEAVNTGPIPMIVTDLV